MKKLLCVLASAVLLFSAGGCRYRRSAGEDAPWRNPESFSEWSPESFYEEWPEYTDEDFLYNLYLEQIDQLTWEAVEDAPVHLGRFYYEPETADNTEVYLSESLWYSDYYQYYHYQGTYDLVTYSEGVAYKQDGWGNCIKKEWDFESLSLYRTLTKEKMYRLIQLTTQREYIEDKYEMINPENYGLYLTLWLDPDALVEAGILDADNPYNLISIEFDFSDSCELEWNENVRFSLASDHDSSVSSSVSASLFSSSYPSAKDIEFDAYVYDENLTWGWESGS